MFVYELNKTQCYFLRSFVFTSLKVTSGNRNRLQTKICNKYLELNLDLDPRQTSVKTYAVNDKDFPAFRVVK